MTLLYLKGRNYAVVEGVTLNTRNKEHKNTNQKMHDTKTRFRTAKGGGRKGDARWTPGKNKESEEENDEGLSRSQK